MCIVVIVFKAIEKMTLKNFCIFVSTFISWFSCILLLFHFTSTAFKLLAINNRCKRYFKNSIFLILLCSSTMSLINLQYHKVKKELRKLLKYYIFFLDKTTDSRVNLVLNYQKLFCFFIYSILFCSTALKTILYASSLNPASIVKSWYFETSSFSLILTL